MERTRYSRMAFTLSQCTLLGPVYIGMPLECHWLTQCTLGYHWATQRILAKKNLVETAPHWYATGEKLTLLAYIGIPLEKRDLNCPALECHRRTFWLVQPTLEHHWRDCNSPHIELNRVSSKPVWNDKIVGHQAASGQVSINSAFTWS